MKLMSELITSRRNPTVLWAASLLEKKNREREHAFIAEGEKLFTEAAVAGLPITHVFLSEESYQRLLPHVSALLNTQLFSQTTVFLLSESCFQKISTEKAPEGIITVIKYLDFFQKCTIINSSESSSSEELSPVFDPSESILMLYAMRDPGNLGAVIRSAVAFGVDRIVVSNDSADLYNPKTVRAAMGSLFRVKATVVSDLAPAIHLLKKSGRRVFAAELSEGALSVTDVSLTSSDVVMIGNEGHGIPDELSAICTGSVYIPICKTTESLNAAVAAAIFMWEQRKSI